MRISILSTDPDHPVNASLVSWRDRNAAMHRVDIARSTGELQGGDILFLISCSEIVGPEVRNRYSHSLVVHASALPEGRGWSPHIWQVLSGADSIPVTLLQADDPVDSGAIWQQEVIELSGHELYDEINARLFDVTLRLMDFAVENADRVVPTPQPDGAASYYRKRTPLDSRLDPDKTIAQQFELLRVADPDRYPCYFEYRGHRYTLQIRKADS